MFGRKIPPPSRVADCGLEGEGALAAAPRFCAGEDRFQLSTWAPRLAFASGESCVLRRCFLWSCCCLAVRLQVASPSIAGGWIAVQWRHLCHFLLKGTSSDRLLGSCSSETLITTSLWFAKRWDKLSPGCSVPGTGVFCNGDYWWARFILSKGWSQVLKEER